MEMRGSLLFTKKMALSTNHLFLLPELECPTPTPPDNGKAVVTPGFPYLTIQCNLNKKMFKNAYFVQCVNLVWGEIPDCVGKLSDVHYIFVIIIVVSLAAAAVVIFVVTLLLS